MSRWVTYEAAGSILGKSTRTIERWAASGRLKKGERQGRTYVEVEGSDPLEVVADTSGKLAEVSAAGAIQTRQLADILSDIRHDAQREIQHARRVSRIASVTSVIAAVMFGGVAVYTGVTYYESELRHVRHVDGLEDRADGLQRERDAAAAARKLAEGRAADAEDQAAHDRARIDEVNAALAGLELPADPSWTTHVAAAGR